MKIANGVIYSILFACISQVSASDTREILVSDCVKDGIPSDLCEKAITENDLDSLRRLGDWYLGHFEDNKKDANKAKIILEKASSLGDSFSNYYLSEHYLTGLNNIYPLDEEKGKTYLQKAVDSEYPKALAKIAYLYFYGTYGFEKDSFKSKKYVDSALKSNVASAENLAGFMYYNGAGFDRDPEKAYEYFLKAANHGLVSAYNNLGFLYEMGQGVAKDEAEAFKWYQKAAKRDLPTGILNLGRCYLYGIGVPSDYIKAFEILLNAANHGNYDAMYLVGWLYRSGYGTKASLSTGFNWLRKAAKHGNAC